MMRLTHTLSALVLLGACFSWAEEAHADLGKVMFVGDSITHGYGAPSYRWPLHKIWVDNGVRFTVVGVTQGNQSHGVAPGTKYAGVPFNNRHSAMSSERAYEIAGRVNASGRLGNSNIFDWLGLDSSYSGNFRIDPATEMPDLFVMLIGTNDTLSDHDRKGGIGAGSNLKDVQLKLLGKRTGKKWNGKGDMDTIVDAMRQANPKARIVILTVPCWYDEGRPTCAAKEDFAAIVEYNKALASWAHWKKVELVDINPGLLDVSRTDKPGVGVGSLFNAQDKLHPTPQGDLIIAGRVAQGLGIAGRTAGLERKSLAGLPSRKPLERDGEVKSNKTNKKVYASGGRLNWGWEEDADLSTGWTVVVQGSVGNGAKGGWVTDAGLVLTAGNGEKCGQLTITESGLKWGETELLSADMAANKQEVRLVWHPGKPAEGIASGFYVWLGDMLVGEALPAAEEEPMKGVQLQNTGKQASRASVKFCAGAYAPAMPSAESKNSESKGA